MRRWEAMFVCALLWVQIFACMLIAAYVPLTVLGFIVVGFIAGADGAVASITATRFGARKPRSDLRK